MHKIPTLILLAIGLGLSGAAALADMETDAPPGLSASDLRDAIGGNRFTYRAVIREGDDAIAFAEGFIAATATVAAREGAWCDPGIAPHELVARVYDTIETLGENATAEAADIAITRTLHGLAPCPEQGFSK